MEREPDSWCGSCDEPYSVDYEACPHCAIFRVEYRNTPDAEWLEWSTVRAEYAAGCEAFIGHSYLETRLVEVT